MVFLLSRALALCALGSLLHEPLAPVTSPGPLEHQHLLETHRIADIPLTHGEVLSLYSLPSSAAIQHKLCLTHETKLVYFGTQSQLLGDCEGIDREESFLLRFSFRNDEILSFQLSSSQHNPFESLVVGMNLTDSALFLSDALVTSAAGELPSELLQGKFLLTAGVSYELSAGLFAGHAAPSEEAVADCSWLRPRLAGPLTFQLLADGPTRFSRDSLAFWLDHCGLAPPALLVRAPELRPLPLAHPHGQNDFLQRTESVCAAGDTNFRSARPALRRSNFHGRHFPLHCLEDFLLLLLHDASNSNSTDPPLAQGMGMGEGDGARWVLPLLPSPSLHGRLAAFQELLLVLRAAGNLPEAVAGNRFLGPTLARGLALRLLDVSPALGEKKPAAASCPADDDEDGPDGLCSLPTQRPLVKEPAPLPPAAAPASERVAAIRRNIAHRRQWKAAVAALENRPVAILSEGDAYALVFVPFFLLAEAEAAIARYKSRCHSLVCHVVVKYLPMPSDGPAERRLFRQFQRLRRCEEAVAAGAEEEEEAGGAECLGLLARGREIRREYFSFRPSLRSALLQTRSFLAEIRTPTAVVLWLRGLEMLLGLVPPSALPAHLVGLPDEKVEAALARAEAGYCDSPAANFFPPFRAVTGPRHFCLAAEITVAYRNPNSPSPSPSPSPSQRPRPRPSGSDGGGEETAGSSGYWLAYRELRRAVEAGALLAKIQTLGLLLRHLAAHLALAELSEAELEAALVHGLLDWHETNGLAVAWDQRGRHFNLTEGAAALGRLIAADEARADLREADEEAERAEVVRRLYALDFLSGRSVYNPRETAAMPIAHLRDPGPNPSNPSRRRPLFPVGYEIDFLPLLRLAPRPSQLLRPATYFGLFEDFLADLPDRVHFFAAPEEQRAFLAAQESRLAEIEAERRARGCRVPLAAFTAAYSPLFLALLSEVRLLAMAALLLNVLEELAACDYFAAVGDFVLYDFMQLAKNARHGLYKVRPEEFLLTAKLLEFYRGLLYRPAAAAPALFEKRIALPFPMPPPRQAQAQGQVEGPKWFGFNGLELILQIAETAVLLEADLFHRSKAVFAQSLQPLSGPPAPEALPSPPFSFAAVMAQRRYWAAERERLQRSQAEAEADSSPSPTSPNPSRLEVVTYASNRTAGLENLLLSSVLAGVKLKVLGLDRPYVDYTSKIEGYHAHLAQAHGTGAAGAEDEAVLLVDAYDVLLFPQIRRAEEVLRRSVAPLLFCAEAGIYVEFAGGFSYYPRGRFNSNQELGLKRYNRTAFLAAGPPRGPQDWADEAEDFEEPAGGQFFLNSGCILGRRREVRSLLSFSAALGPSIRDDQQIVLRYWLLFPALAALDVHHDFSLTTFQQGGQLPGLLLTPAFQLLQRRDFAGSAFPGPVDELPADDLEAAAQWPRPRRSREFVSIGLLHANNKNSNGLYDHFAGLLRRHFQLYNSSAPATASAFFGQPSAADKKRRLSQLLRAVWLLSDQQFGRALGLLQELGPAELRGLSQERLLPALAAYRGQDIAALLMRLALNGLAFPDDV